MGAFARVRRTIADYLSPLEPVYDAWMQLIAGFSWVLVRVLLAVAFVTVFTLYGLLVRVSGRDPLDRAIDPDCPSYWSDHVVQNANLEDFRKLY
jgi:hypothetical protein